jgi:hypothetical protein
MFDFSLLIRFGQERERTSRTSVILDFELVFCLLGGMDLTYAPLMLGTSH